MSASPKLYALLALSGVVRCEAALGETGKMQQAIAEMEVLLPKIPASKRDQWSQWLTVVRKPIAPEK